MQAIKLPHYEKHVRVLLHEHIHDRRIGLCRCNDTNMQWSSHWTDLTAEDFLLWIHIGKLVYDQNYRDVDPFKNPTASELLQVTSELVASAVAKLVKCLILMLEVDGCRI